MQTFPIFIYFFLPKSKMQPKLLLAFLKDVFIIPYGFKTWWMWVILCLAIGPRSLDKSD